MATDPKPQITETAAVEEMHRKDAPAVAKRYGMTLEAAQRLLDDLRNVFAVWAFLPLDPRGDAVRDRAHETRQRVLAILPRAIEQATAEAHRYGLEQPKTAAVNALVAAMAGVSVRTVERIRAAIKRPTD
jgi:hypothetical protein